MPLDLFPDNKIIGVFRGFQEGGMEFHADLVLPYRNEFQNIPMHGQFLLVQLESQEEAVLGRISSLSSDGKLSFGAGEEYNLRAMREHRVVPEDLREQYLKYRVNIRVLGVIRQGQSESGKLTFVASHRRLPHVGSPVALPDQELLQEIAGHNIAGASIGFYALGEYVYAGSNPKLEKLEWMQVKHPEVLVKFPVKSLVARRTFIFARAGFGKSNLNKLLFSELYKETPTVTKRGDRQVPVGTIIFDPDGEYFWPDDKNRPGLCDVPELQDKLVVFTSREGPSDFYQSFVAGGIKLDIRQLRPSDVIAIAVSKERQDQQNIRKLRGLNTQKWTQLVDLIDAQGNSASINDVGRILELDERSEAEATAARSNMTSIVRTLHDKSSRMLDMLLEALRAGKLCVVDVSQMRGGQSLILSGIILNRIFTNNQEEFTKAEPATIPTIAVIEEAQSVLNENATSAEPYIAWVKEGRKYDLGALLVTQQPGSIPAEILSQGDNWFLFHLLSTGDLTSVRKANAHFSEDLLSSLLNEPIPGQGVFWSSVESTPYPIALRALDFEKLNTVQDPQYSRPAVQTFAQTLQKKNEEILERARQAVHDRQSTNGTGESVDVDLLPETEDPFVLTGDEGNAPVDMQAGLLAVAINALHKNEDLLRGMSTHDGVQWYRVQMAIADAIRGMVSDERQKAYELLPTVLDNVFGLSPRRWDTRNNAADGKKHIFIKAEASS